MKHKSGCEFKVTQTGSDILLTMKGSIDENCQWPEFKGTLMGHLKIDLDQVSLINSFGSRDWAKWISSIKAAKGISLHRCTTTFVRQMNIFAALVPKGTTIDSFYVHYLCLSCNNDKFVLLEKGKDYFPPPKPLLPKSIPCPRCQASLEIDSDSERYYHFLTFQSAS